MLELQDLHIHYGGIHAVRGLNLTVGRGEIVTLIGANGAGKSSTVRGIAGLVKGLSGRILHTGAQGETVNLAGLPPEKVVARGIAMSPEGRRILPHLTVAENLALGAYSRRDLKAIQADREWVYSLFPRLKERHWQPGGTLSGGEQQMLAISRALMARPRLLLLDEPSLGLAPLIIRQIFDIIQTVNAGGATVFLVEQNAHQALKIAHRGYVMENGRITLEGASERLLNNPEVRRAYLGI